MKTTTTASADWGAFLDVKQIMAWFGNCLFYSLLYISPWHVVCSGSRGRVFCERIIAESWAARADSSQLSKVSGIKSLAEIWVESCLENCQLMTRRYIGKNQTNFISLMGKSSESLHQLFIVIAQNKKVQWPFVDPKYFNQKIQRLVKILLRPRSKFLHNYLVWSSDGKLSSRLWRGVRGAERPRCVDSKQLSE